MARYDFDAQKWLEQALADTARASTDHGGGGVTTIDVLAEFGSTWPAPLTKPDEESLDALCRKIHVVRRVMDRYRAGWHADPAGRPIGADAWRLLIVVLLAYASAPWSDRSLALKLINAAYAGIDLAGAALTDATRRGLLESAAGMLDRVLAERAG